MAEDTQEAAPRRASARRGAPKRPAPRRLPRRIRVAGGIPREATLAECYLLAAILHPMGVEGLCTDEPTLSESEVCKIADQVPGCPPGLLFASPT